MNKHQRRRMAQGLCAGTLLLTGIGTARAQTAAPTSAPTTAATPAAAKATPAASLAPASPASASPAATTTPAPAGSPGAAGKTASPKPGASPAAIAPSASPAAAVPVAPVATAPAPIVVNIAAPAVAREEPTSNSWVPGLVGLALLAGVGVFGFRYAKGRGLTVPGVLKQIGVEMPQDGVNGAGQVQPLRPVAPPAPPLPSLSDLPSASTAPVSSAPSFGSAPAAPLPLAGVPRLIGLAGPVSGELFEVSQGLTLGRDAENHVPLAGDTTVSRRHARVEAAPTGGFQVSDLGSSNGTFVNGQRVSGTRPLSSGDQIQIGTSRLRFEV